MKRDRFTRRGLVQVVQGTKIIEQFRGWTLSQKIYIRNSDRQPSKLIEQIDTTFANLSASTRNAF